jgi:hypothetical protein
MSAVVDRSIPVRSTTSVWLNPSLSATAIITASCRGVSKAGMRVSKISFAHWLARCSKSRSERLMPLRSGSVIPSSRHRAIEWEHHIRIRKIRKAILYAHPLPPMLRLRRHVLQAVVMQLTLAPSAYRVVAPASVSTYSIAFAGADPFLGVRRTPVPRFFRLGPEERAALQAPGSRRRALRQ